MSNEIDFGCSKGVSVELFLELLLMLPVLVIHDVQNGYDFNLVSWPLHFEFSSYASVIDS